MAGKPKHAIEDPATGEVVTLPQLAQRHGMNADTLRRRYWEGQRGWDLVKAYNSWRGWNSRELKLLDKHYRDGTPVDEIAKIVGHSIPAVKRRAQERGLKHPGRSTQACIERFERQHGRPLLEIATEYRDRRLSRTELASGIGITYQTLRRFLPDELWQSWPRMTIGRIDAARQRRKAASQ